jgi:hypothetical protein
MTKVCPHCLHMLRRERAEQATCCPRCLETGRVVALVVAVPPKRPLLTPVGSDGRSAP